MVSCSSYGLGAPLTPRSSRRTIRQPSLQPIRFDSAAGCCCVVGVLQHAPGPGGVWIRKPSFDNSGRRPPVFLTQGDGVLPPHLRAPHPSRGVVPAAQSLSRLIELRRRLVSGGAGLFMFDWRPRSSFGCLTVTDKTRYQSRSRRENPAGDGTALGL